MKIDQIVLIVVIGAALVWLGVVVAGMISIMPWGLLGLIALAILVAVLGRVIYQRMHNAEDDYYEKNVDK